MNHDWQLVKPLDAIIMDCDGTLSAIEGIDELAKQNGVAEKVEALTQEAMTKTGITTELYEERVQLVQPSRQQLFDLGEQYYLHRVPDIEAVLNVFRYLNKTVFVVSAGLNPAVKLFASQLNIFEERVYAVDVYFNAQGGYRDYDRKAPTARAGGKREIVGDIKDSFPRTLLIGDGKNDLEAQDMVERFVGYGGSYYRENIAKACNFYIKNKSLLSLLPLSLTPQEAKQLPPELWQHYEMGLQALTTGDVIIKS